MINSFLRQSFEIIFGKDIYMPYSISSLQSCLTSGYYKTVKEKEEYCFNEFKKHIEEKIANHGYLIPYEFYQKDITYDDKNYNEFIHKIFNGLDVKTMQNVHDLKLKILKTQYAPWMTDEEFLKMREHDSRLESSEVDLPNFPSDVSISTTTSKDVSTTSTDAPTTSVPQYPISKMTKEMIRNYVAFAITTKIPDISDRLLKYVDEDAKPIFDEFKVLVRYASEKYYPNEAKRHVYYSCSYSENFHTRCSF